MAADVGAAEIGGAAARGLNAGTAAEGAEGAEVSVSITDSKFDYLFGNVSSNAHNLARSLQNGSELSQIGIYDTTEGQALLQSNFESAVNNPSSIIQSFSNQYGNFQTNESLLAGPGGFLKMQSTFQIMDNGGYRFITAIPFGGQ